MSNAIPTVVIVGRPNVGKSTLFNRITGQRRAIVGDEPGITRDRLHGAAEHDGRHFELIDTGGIVVHDQEYIPAQILKQAEYALKAADHIIFLVDGRAEITGSDRDLAQMLQRLGKPVSLAVNKIDAPLRENLVHEFYSLGIPDAFPISAEHGIGVDAMLDQGDGGLCARRETGRDRYGSEGNQGRDHRAAERGQIDAAECAHRAGSRDRLADRRHHPRRRGRDGGRTTGTEFIFVDTAGIRRKGKTHDMAEKLSVVMARRHIRMAHVVLLVLDATEGVVALDTTIAGYAHEGGRALIICVNKWDEVKGQAAQKKNEFEQQIRDEFKFLDYAPVVFLSAKSGSNVPKLFRADSGDLRIGVASGSPPAS